MSGALCKVYGEGALCIVREGMLYVHLGREARSPFLSSHLTLSKVLIFSRTLGTLLLWLLAFSVAWESFVVVILLLKIFQPL